MSLAFALKVLCDLCFYFAFANFASYSFGGSAALPVLPLFAACAYASALLTAKGGLRFLPLAALPACFFILPVSLPNILLLLPAIGYVFIFVSICHADGQARSLAVGSAEVFTLFLKIYAFFVFLMLLFQARRQLEAASLPFAFVFLIAYVVLMRMQRHSIETNAQARFKLINFYQVLSVVLVGALLGSRQAIAMLVSALQWTYFQIIAPILMIVVTAMLYILWPLFWLLSQIPESTQEAPELDAPSAAEFIEQEMAASPAAGYAFMRALLYLGLFALAAWLVYLLFRRLLTPEAIAPQSSAAVEQRASLPKARRPAKRRLRSENKVRDAYRRFLGMCRKFGIERLPQMTSADYESRTRLWFRAPADAARLREIYIRVRYGEREAGRADAKAMREMLSGFRKRT